MKAEDQLIAIAKACGWRRDRHGDWISAKGDYNYDSDEFPCLPDYLNDLNACHEMEKILKPEQWIPYVNAIFPEHDHNQLFRIGSIMHATAAQRCEAFLRTLGLWKEIK